MVREGHVADAVVFLGLNKGADCHADAEVDIAVAHHNVLRALSDLVLFVARLDRHGVVVVCNVEAFNEDVLSVRVNAISVESIDRQSLVVQMHVLEGAVLEACGAKEKFSKLKLALMVDPDFEVVQVHRVDILKLHVELGGVDPADPADFNVDSPVDVEETRSAVPVHLDVLTYPPHETLAVDGTAATESDVLDIFEGDQVADNLVAVIKRPPEVILGQFDGSVDCESHVADVGRPNSAHVVDMIGRNQNLVGSLGEVGSNDSVHEGLSVDLLSIDGVVVVEGTEVANVEHFLRHGKPRAKREASYECNYSFQHFLQCFLFICIPL